ncbi:MAG: hypothetical protein ACR2KV_11890 [Solirubrobacteraceae bacterium]
MHAARRLLAAVTALLAVGMVLAAPAFSASAFENIFSEYQSTQTVKACKHSTAELQAAKNQVPPDINQYAPDFPAAIQAALEARAHGVCGGAAATGGGSGSGSGGTTALPTVGGGTTGAATPVSGTAPGPTPAPFASPAAASPIATAAAHAGGGGASSVPAPLLALAILMILLASAAVYWTVATLRGHEPERLSSAGHAVGEVRARAGGTLREFADWLRLGR